MLLIQIQFSILCLVDSFPVQGIGQSQFLFGTAAILDFKMAANNNNFVKTAIAISRNPDKLMSLF